MYVITRVAEFGELIVYQRGAWAYRQRLPKYVVGRNCPDGEQRMLEEFKRLAPALRWAAQQSEAITQLQQEG